MIEELKNIFGPKCTAISVNSEPTEPVDTPSKPMKFCEAVSYSFRSPVKLVNENLGCPGARRSIGFDNDDALLAQTISGNNKIPIQFILNALEVIPTFKGIKYINLGLTTEMEKEIQPDLYIIYTRPAVITTLVHNLAKIEIKPSLPPYSLL